MKQASVYWTNKNKSVNLQMCLGKQKPKCCRRGRENSQSRPLIAPALNGTSFRTQEICERFSLNIIYVFSSVMFTRA